MQSHPPSGNSPVNTVRQKGFKSLNSIQNQLLYNARINTHHLHKNIQRCVGGPLEHAQSRVMHALSFYDTEIDTFARCAAVGQRLVTPVDKFTNAHTIEVECHCGHIRRTNLASVEKSANCIMCRENHAANPTVRSKMRATNLERRGVENPFADPSVQAKVRATNLARRGVEYSGADPSVQAKMRETNLERRCVEHPFSDPTVQAKIRSTNIVRRGVENVGSDPEVRGKRNATMLERYGTIHSLHVPEILEKMTLNRFKSVPRTLEDGRIVALQGYEYPALQWLLSESSFIDPTLGRRLVVSDLVFGKAQVPKIMYDGHRYYTDMAVLNSTTIIEVKSPYTLRQDWDVNIAKFEASILAGYTLVLITWGKKSIVDFTILRPTDSAEALALAMEKIAQAASHKPVATRPVATLVKR